MIWPPHIATRCYGAVCLVTTQAKSGGMPMSCPFCQRKYHPLFCCFPFSRLTHADKIKYLKKQKRCLCCLREGHVRKECTQMVFCNYCMHPASADHNQIIHEDEEITLTVQAMVAKGLKPGISLVSKGQVLRRREISTSAFVITMECPKTGREVQLNALANEGASDFLVDTSVLDVLPLEGAATEYTVLGHHGKRTVHQTCIGIVNVVDPRSKGWYPVCFVCYDRPCPEIEAKDEAKLKNNFQHLKDLPIPPPVPGRHIEVLVGSRYTQGLQARSPLWEGRWEDPVAWQTIVGMVVNSRTSCSVARLGTACVSWVVPAIVGHILLALSSSSSGGSNGEDETVTQDDFHQQMAWLWGTRLVGEEVQLKNLHSPAIKSAAEDQLHWEHWPLAFSITMENIIVDDILVSAANPDEIQLEALFLSMGMKPHKWASYPRPLHTYLKNTVQRRWW